MKKFYFIALFVLAFAEIGMNHGVAQENTTAYIPSIKSVDDVHLLYRNEREYGLVIHSSGWGINYRRGKHVTGYKKRTFEIEMVGMRHPKEIKRQLSGIGSKGYFYGKQFIVTVLRGGYGFHKVITGKSDRRGVEIRLVTLAGPSLALAKPVYLEIWHPDPIQGNPKGFPVYERYDPKNPYHVPYNGTYGIIGRAGYLRGFSEMNFFPGGFLKVGLSFEHSNIDDDIKLLETGIVVDAFYKTIPIMAKSPNNQVYVNVYLNFMFGKKWF